MCLQMDVFTECFIIHITSKTTMYASMSYHTAMFTECLITYFTWIWTLPSMYRFVLSDCSFEWMQYYTLDRHKGVHYNICVDVF